MMADTAKTCSPNCPCGKCKNYLQKIRAIDFAIQETVLYLDGYPTCRQALDYYHQLIKERAMLLAVYEDDCGPMTMYGNENNASWDWVKGPWPWEKEAN